MARLILLEHVSEAEGWVTLMNSLLDRVPELIGLHYGWHDSWLSAEKNRVSTLFEPLHFKNFISNSCWDVWTNFWPGLGLLSFCRQKGPYTLFKSYRFKNLWHIKQWFIMAFALLAQSPDDNFLQVDRLTTKLETRRKLTYFLPCLVTNWILNPIDFLALWDYRF